MSAPALEPGRIVGQRYTIRRVVAHGASSSLYEAITAPSREILLEVFAPDTAVASNVDARLERLVNQVNALPAAVVLPILEAGIDGESGCPFIASEASATPALAELVKLCPLAGEELVAFVSRLCAALDAAHAHDLVHAALDPTKVFVGPAPRCDVRLAGLGTAMLRGHACDPTWAAPEAYAPTPASDVYSAALLILYAASGELPPSPAAVVNALARDTASAALPAPAFDRRIAAPLARALAPAASERQGSAGELARAIAEALGSSFVVSSSWRAAERAREPERGGDELLPIPPHPPPLPAAATSVDALTTPVGASAPIGAHDEPRSDRRLGARTKVLVAVAAAAVLFAVFGVAIASVIIGAPKRAASPVASAPPPLTAAPTPMTPPPSATAAPTPVVASAPVPSDRPPVPAAEATLVVECTPECASITVDGTPVENRATLKPGAHVVVVKRGVHAPQTKYVKLTAGRETTVSFIWWRYPPGPPKTGGAKKPCGKFLQRCD